MSDPTPQSFRYRLEQQPPHTTCGGLVRGASVRQFPVSQGIAGASMRLQPGCLRCIGTRLLPSWVTLCLAVAAPLY
jgi:oxalate decarboxylase